MAIVAKMNEVTKRMKDGTYCYEKEGKCSGCGNCCSNFLPMTQEEKETIKKYIKRYKIKPYVRAFPLKDPTVDATCPFRNEDKGICTIYEVRPSICKYFTCNPEKSLGMMKQMALDPNYEPGKYKIVVMREEFYNI